MKILKYSALVLGLSLFCFPSQEPTDRLIQTTIPAPSLANNLFDTPAEQPLIVCLPTSYHTSKARYPVVYFLPGFTTDVTEMIDGTFQGLNILTALDGLVGSDKIRELIFVVANGRNFLGGSFYVNSPVTGNWEDFIVKDVVQYVDKNFRTLANAASRGISGSSMGGFGAVNLGMRHPDVFSAVYSLSPGLFDEEGLTSQGMFVPEDKIARYLAKQEEFDAMPQAEAKQAFKAFIAELYGARSMLQYFWAFSYAYGAAISPNPEKGVPYIDYPYTQSGDSVRLNREILQNYINGFGGQAEKVRAYKDSLLKLKGLTIDIGKNDPFRWIVQGSRHFAQLLHEMNIPHELVEHDGGHEDRLRERIENHLLPFFSEHLVAE
jgi:S-formylglutathione hydrolase FrmB